MPLRQRPALTVILAVILTACGTAKASPLSRTTSSVALRPSTVASAAPTTSPAPLTAPTATTATTAVPTAPTAPTATTTVPTATTAAPVTTTIIESDESIMQRAITKNAIVDVYHCFARPTGCDLTQDTTTQGTFRFNVTSNAKHLADRNWQAKDDPADPTYITVRSATVTADRRSAVVMACLWDTGVIFEPNAAPDGTDIIADDVKKSHEMRFQMVYEHPRWLVSIAEDLSQKVAENTCAKPA